MLYQNIVQGKHEIDRIKFLLSKIDDFCKKIPINLADYQPTPSLQYAVSCWINDATSKNIDSFRLLSPAIQGVLGVALKKGLQDKLNQLKLNNSK